jgi:hypothetical protein
VAQYKERTAAFGVRSDTHESIPVSWTGDEK